MKVYEDIFLKFNTHLLEDSEPSKYFREASHTKLFLKFPFSLLKEQIFTEQSPIHHPEGNVFEHTLKVVDEAAKIKNLSKDQKVFMWAALLHDIGKPATTKSRKNKITSYDHDKEGEKLSKLFLGELTNEKDFINKVSKLIRWHMQILFVVKDLPFKDILNMKKETDINEVALLGFCDRLGRGGVDRKREQDNIKIFLKKANKFFS